MGCLEEWILFLFNFPVARERQLEAIVLGNVALADDLLAAGFTSEFLFEFTRVDIARPHHGTKDYYQLVQVLRVQIPDGLSDDFFGRRYIDQFDIESFLHSWLVVAIAAT